MMPNKKPMHIYSIQISKEWFYQNTRRKCAVNIQRSDSDVIRWKVISMRSTTAPWITVRQMPLHCSITGCHRQSRDLTTRLLLSPQLCPVLCSVCIVTWFSYYQILYVYNVTSFSNLWPSNIGFFIHLYLKSLTDKYVGNIAALISDD